MRKQCILVLVTLGQLWGCQRDPDRGKTRTVETPRGQRRQVVASSTPVNAGETSGEATQLFGVALNSANRNQLKQALTGKGAKLNKSSGHVDVYDSGQLLDESKQLEVAFTSEGRFARATYTFPSFMDAPQVARIADLVRRKYGAPTRSQGDVQLGDVRFEWQLNDGVRVVVHRGWPSTTTYLEYHHPLNSTQLNQELEQNQAQDNQQNFVRQKDAL